MRHELSRTMRRAALFFVGTSAMACTHAACVDPTNPLASPVTGVEMFYDIHLPGRKIERPNNEPLTTSELQSWREVASPVVSVDYGLPTLPSDERIALYFARWNKQQALHPVDEMGPIGHTTLGQGFGVVNERSDGRPPFVWPNHIDPVAADRKALGEIGGSVYFYEPDTRGGRRLCRMERWGSRTRIFDSETEKNVARKDPIDVPASPNQTRNPALAALSRDYVMIGYSNLVYDDKGRLPHIGPTCFYYTDDGQVKAVAFQSDNGKCENKPLDPKRDPSIEVLFNGQGRGYGAVLTRPISWEAGEDLNGATRWRAHGNGATNGWKQSWRFKFGGGYVSAYANDRTGITVLETSGSLGENDDTIYNEYGKGEQSRFQMVRNQSRREYGFPIYMPTEWLRNPNALYQYERVRLTGRSVQLAERFAAGGSQLLDRIWVVGATGNVPRRERFKDGKLVRAIVTDFTTEEQHGELWIEDLESYREKIKVPFENVYIRIYNYDAEGKESLVAVGWTDYPRPKFYAHHRPSGRRQELANMVDALNPFKAKEDVPARLTYFFGTPDGQVKWTWEEFSKEFDLKDEQGLKAVFPNGRNNTDIRE